MMKRLLLGLIVFATLLTAATPSAYAVSGSDWKAGLIIDDILFTNKTDMSVADIQNFLNSKLPSCDTNGVETSELGGGTRAQYGAANGNPAPFTCLNNYYEVPKTTPGPAAPVSNYGLSTIPAGALSAAQLIYNAAQAHSISPKVLLIKLATESPGPLTSDEWPFKRQYLYAMGAHCPDSGPGGSANCDINYSGFSLQMDEAASLLRWYLDSMGEAWWQYKKPYQVNNILWNIVETGCGGSDVYIESKATAALYTYTPYQPNAAALNNMYGTGDGCSAYGNRNFWRLYNDWFGPTSGTPFFSNRGKVYMIGASNSYYYVPSQALLSAYGFGSKFNGITPVGDSFLTSLTYRGNLSWVSRFDGLDIYAISNMRKYKFNSESSYLSYGYSFGQESVLTANLLSAYVTGGTMQAVMKQTDRTEVYSVNQGSRRHISSWQAFTTLGTPTYSTQPSVTIGSDYARTLPLGNPIISDGTVVKSTTTGNQWVTFDDVLYPVASSSLSSWSLANAATYSASDTVINQLTKSATTLGAFIHDSVADKYYVLDQGRKLLITTEQMSSLGLAPESFVDAPAKLLALFSAKTMSTVVQQSGSLPAYAAINGKLYHIYGEDDLTGLGYNWSQLVALKSSTMSLLTKSGQDVYRPGKLVQISGRPEVYLVENGFNTRHIPTQGIFSQYGFSYQNVAVVGSAGLSAYTAGTPLSRYITDGQGANWLVDQSKRVTIDSSTMTSYGLTQASFMTINSRTLTSLPVSSSPLGILIRASGKLEVYKVDGGQKHWIPSEQVLFANGYSFSMVRIVSKDYVDSIPTGANL